MRHVTLNVSLLSSVWLTASVNSIATETLETPVLTITSTTASLGGDTSQWLERGRKIEKRNGRRPGK